MASQTVWPILHLSSRMFYYFKFDHPAYSQGEIINDGLQLILFSSPIHPTILELAFHTFFNSLSTHIHNRK